jgi:hypothetical protein
MQSNNNKMISNNDDFKLVGKKLTNASVLIISCEHCQRSGHKIDKCFLLANLERLKTTVCVYCRATGHNNKNCPVSKANAEKKRIKAEIWKLNMDQAKEIQLQKDMKYATDFPLVLSTEASVVPEQLKFAWASVAMANRDPIKLKKIDDETAVVKEIFKKQEHLRRVNDNLEKKLEKKEAEKQHWLTIKPVVLAMKEAYPTSWIYKLENTSYDTDQASNLRYEDQRKKELAEEEAEIRYYKEEETCELDEKKRHEARLLMTKKELEEDNRQIEEDYEDTAAAEQNSDLSFIFRYSQYEKHRPKIVCTSCDVVLDAGNQGSRCIPCIFQLGDI